MKNIAGVYINHPEAVWIFLFLLVLFMVLVPIFHLYLIKKRQEKFKNLESLYTVKISDSDIESSKCHFCGSSRAIKELILEAPVIAKFRFITVKENGLERLYQSRCSNCGAKLAVYKTSQ